MLKILMMILSLISPEEKPTRTRVGKGSTFYPVEKGLNNGILACGGGEWVNPEQPYCASRTIPCGTWVRIENVHTGDAAWCKVMDRGPYGKTDASGNWFNAATDRKAAEKTGRLPRVGKYRGIIDMSKSVSRQLGSRGMVKVRLSWWKNNELAPILDSILVK